MKSSSKEEDFLSEDILQTTSNAIVELNKCRTQKELEERIFEIINSEISKDEPFLEKLLIASAEEASAFATDYVDKFDITIPLAHRGTLVAHLYAKFRNPKAAKLGTDFILNISSVIAIVYSRNSYINTIKRTKKMWEATFDAIEDPLCLIDSEYNILQSNGAYNDKLPGKKRGVSTKCYMLFAGRISPCPSCSLLSTSTEFDMNQYHVYAYPITQNLHVLRYKDMTRKKQVESNIAIASGLAEAGILAGSIAHEINNPLAGILTFLNLVEMDTQSDDPNLMKVKEMEAMVIECKKIVEKILMLARKADKSYQDTYLVQNMIDEVLTIVNPEARLRKINIEIKNEEEIPPTYCYPNVLRQVFLTIIQSAIKSLIGEENRKLSINSILEKRKKEIVVTFNTSKKIILSELDLVLLDSLLEESYGHIEHDTNSIIVSIPQKKKS